MNEWGGISRWLRLFNMLEPLDLGTSAQPIG
jgi:hypothetical protein